MFYKSIMQADPKAFVKQSTKKVAQQREDSLKQKVVYNAYNYFKRRRTDDDSKEYRTDENITKLVAVATGVNESTVKLIISEGNTATKNTGNFYDIEQTKKQEELNVNDYDLGGIRKTIYQMYTEQKVLPSIRRLAATLNENGIVDCRQPEIIRQLLCKIGYCYEKIDEKRSILIERTDVIEKRFDYLRTIHNCRAKNKNNIVFVSETTLNSIAYGDIGQECGLNVMFAGCRNGLIVDTLEINSSDQEITTTMFHQWVEHKLKNKLPPNSVIVMGNESYQCLQINKTPTIESLKSEMQEWLSERNVYFAPDMSKVELLKIISFIPQQIIYKVHEILQGHTVLHVPPFHTDLNPIKMVLKDIKENLVSQCLLTMEEKAVTLKRLFSEYPVEKFQKYDDLICGIEREYWIYDMKMDMALDDFILGLQMSGAASEFENDADNFDSEISNEDEIK